MNPSHHSPPLTSRRISHLFTGVCLLAAACTTPDPRPGLGEGGNPGLGSGGGWGVTPGAGGGTGGGVHFGDGGAGGGDPGIPNRACGDAPTSAQSFTKKRLLESAGACSAYHVCNFSNAVTELARRVTTYAGDPSDENLARTRSAWTDAMLAWALSAPAQYGPVASVAADKYHGRGIGAFIHAWPALNRCEVDKQVATRAYEDQGFARVLPGARGLSALEYLLFYQGTDTSCASNSTAAKAWALLSADELAEAKRAYAEAVVTDLYYKSEELIAVWSSQGEDFGAKLANGSGYGSEQEALNVVAWSLLYPYEVIRDLKIGPLAGIGTALFNPETPYALVDLQSIQANVGAFRALFQGCGEEGQGIGFDDWLEAAGAGDLSQDIVLALNNVEAHAGELPALHQASQAQMAAFYADLKVLSDLLKEELFGSGSVLNLKLPASAASDTD
jgi:uncharacterized protein